MFWKVQQVRRQLLLFLKIDTAFIHKDTNRLFRIGSSIELFQDVTHFYLDSCLQI